MDHSDSKKPSGYLLIIRGYEWDKSLSPDELQQTMSRFSEWIADITGQGIVLGANPLLQEGNVVSGPNGTTVTDGPFAESKEAVAGYFLLQVDTLEEATAIAKRCPLLDRGPMIEVRPIATMCPVQRAAEELVRAAAGR